MDSLQDKILANYFQSNFDDRRRNFLPEGILVELITEGSLVKELQIEDLTHESLSLVRYIQSHALKLFAIVLMIDLNIFELQHAMRKFERNNFTDQSLPVKEAEMAELACFRGRPWTRKVRVINFFRTQWTFLAPVFSNTKFQLDLEPECILPITWSSSETKEGAFSQVFKAKIHESHYEDPTLKADDLPLYVAIKEIKKISSYDELEEEANNEWEAESKALDKISFLNHPNIVQCISAFTRGRKRYFMFQWADGGNLRDFWEQNPKPRLTSPFVKEIVLQLQGLTRALKTLHNYMGSWRHGDLKPENILRFTDSTTVGTLKITDFGLAKHHDFETEERQFTTTRFGTVRYEAPEVITQKGAEARSRLYDIWSMGCIALELLVWLLYGYEELLRFNDEIRGPLQESSAYYKIEDKHSKFGLIATIHPSVQAYMDFISEDQECKGITAIKDLLRLIKTQMLVVQLPQSKLHPRNDDQLSLNIPSIITTNVDDPSSNISLTVIEHSVKPTLLGPFRATAQEVCDFLDEMIRKGDENEAYWSTGVPRDFLRGPSRQVLSKVNEYILGFPESAFRTRVFPLEQPSNLKQTYRISASINMDQDTHDMIPKELPVTKKGQDTKPLDPKLSSQKDLIQFGHMLAQFEKGCISSLLASRASLPQTRWSSSGHLKTANAQESLVPEWFLRMFVRRQFLPDGVTVVHDDDSQYYFSLDPAFQASSISESSEDNAFLEALAIVAHATPEISAEIGWDSIQEMLRTPLQNVYTKLLALTSPEIEELLRKSSILAGVHVENMLRIINSITRSITPSRFSLLPSFLVNLDSIAKRLLLDKEIFMRIKMMISFLKTMSSTFTPTAEDLTKFLKRASTLNRHALSISILELDIRLPSSFFHVQDRMTDCEKFWADAKKFYLDNISRAASGSPLESLTEAVVCVRAMKDTQTIEAEAVAEKAELDLQGELVPRTLLSFFLIRHNLYISGEKVLKTCVKTLLGENSQFALAISTTELVNCRNRIGMAKAGAEAAESVLSRTVTKETFNAFLSLRIAYSDSLIGQGMFHAAEELLQGIMKTMTQSFIVIACGLRLSKLRRRNGHNDEATEISSYLWQAVSHLEPSTSYLAIYCVEETCASVLLPDEDETEAMRTKEKLLDLCMERIETFPDQIDFSNLKETLEKSKKHLIHRINAKETRILPGTEIGVLKSSLYRKKFSFGSNMPSLQNQTGAESNDSKEKKANPLQSLKVTSPLLKTNKPLENRLPEILQETSGFFPRDLIVNLVDEKCVVHELRESFKGILEDEEIKNHAQKICGVSSPIVESKNQPIFKNIFVILILCEKVSAIPAFLAEELSDSDLPLVKVPIPGKTAEFFGLGRKEKPTELLKSFQEGWSTSAVRNFEQWQWTTQAPYFERSTGKKVNHYEFQDQIILPFIGKIEHDVNAYDRVDGGTSQVMKVDIHPLHHNFHDFSVHNRNFAVKCLSSRNHEDFKREVEILQMFRGNHTHMVSLLSTYEQSKRFNLIFYWADADLLTYWRQVNSAPSVELKTISWMIEQCQGIADALAKIHRFETIKFKETKKNLYGRHGDIKPENLLWFRDPSGTHGGTLQITDFGHAEFQDFPTLLRKPSSKVAFSASYRPPECDLPGGLVDQSFDIWTLGCLYLEFTSWLLGGWNLVQEFRKRRSSVDPFHFNIETDTFFKVVTVKENETVGAKIKPEVADFIFELHSHKACTDYLHDFLNLIRLEMMVVQTRDPRDKCRISSKHLDEKLLEMLRNCEEDEDYAARPSPWSRIKNKRIRQEQANLEQKPEEVVEFKVTETIAESRRRNHNTQTSPRLPLTRTKLNFPTFPVRAN